MRRPGLVSAPTMLPPTARDQGADGCQPGSPGPSGVAPDIAGASGGTSTTRKVTRGRARAIVATALDRAALPLSTTSSTAERSRRNTRLPGAVTSDTKSVTRVNRRSSRTIPGGSRHPGSSERTRLAAPVLRRTRSRRQDPSDPRRSNTSEAADGRGDAVTTVWPGESSRRTAATVAAAAGVGTGGKLPTTKTTSGPLDSTGTGHYRSPRTQKSLPYTCRLVSHLVMSDRRVLDDAALVPATR